MLIKTNLNRIRNEKIKLILFLQLPGHLQVRLQNCRDFPPRTTENFISNRRESNTILLRWLHRLQFKMGQIEMQSSTATQFYSI